MLNAVATPNDFAFILGRLRVKIAGAERNWLKTYGSQYPNANVFATVCTRLFQDQKRQKTYATMDDAALEVLFFSPLSSPLLLTSLLTLSSSLVHRD